MQRVSWVSSFSGIAFFARNDIDVHFAGSIVDLYNVWIVSLLPQNIPIDPIKAFVIDEPILIRPDSQAHFHVICRQDFARNVCPAICARQVIYSRPLVVIQQWEVSERPYFA